jgi:hypothetical protein
MAIRRELISLPYVSVTLMTVVNFANIGMICMIFVFICNCYQSLIPYRDDVESRPDLKKKSDSYRHHAEEVKDLKEVRIVLAANAIYLLFHLMIHVDLKLVL